MAVASDSPVTGWEIRSSPFIGEGGLTVRVDEAGNFSVAGYGTGKKSAAALLRLLALEVEESE